MHLIDPFDSQEDIDLRHAINELSAMTCPCGGALDDSGGCDNESLTPAEHDEVVDGATTFYVNVYRLNRYFGGPEEGGWWYDVGTVEGPSIAINGPRARDRANEVRDGLTAKYPDKGERYSMMPRTQDYEVRVETHPAAHWPEATPRYE